MTTYWGDPGGHTWRLIYGEDGQVTRMEQQPEGALEQVHVAERADPVAIVQAGRILNRDGLIKLRRAAAVVAEVQRDAEYARLFPPSHKRALTLAESYRMHGEAFIDAATHEKAMTELAAMLECVRLEDDYRPWTVTLQFQPVRRPTRRTLVGALVALAVIVALLTLVGAL